MIKMIMGVDHNKIFSRIIRFYNIHKGGTAEGINDIDLIISLKSIYIGFIGG